MPHNVSLISTIAAGFGLALVFGYIAARLKVPPLVGYLAVGILSGRPRRGSWPMSTSPGNSPRSA